MKRLSSLSVVFPCLNDAKILPYLLAKIYTVAPRICCKTLFEVIVVNDGSTDDTPEVLVVMKRHFPNLRVIRHAHPHGYGGAIRAGLAKARFDWVFYTDGDGQYDVGDIPKLVRKVGRHIDVVNGFRLGRGDPWYRMLLGTLYNRYLQVRFRPPVRDVDCDFRLIRHTLLKKINLTTTSCLFPLELVLKLKAAGARFAEVPVKHYPRPFGRSQFFRFHRLIAMLKEHIAFYRKF